MQNYNRPIQMHFSIFSIDTSAFTFLSRKWPMPTLKTFISIYTHYPLPISLPIAAMTSLDGDQSENVIWLLVATSAGATSQ